MTESSFVSKQILQRCPNNGGWVAPDPVFWDQGIHSPQPACLSDLGSLHQATGCLYTWLRRLPSMPPYPNAPALIRANLEALQSGQRVKGVAIGTLTAAQLNAINAERTAEENRLPPILEEVIFFGSHAYQSRVLQDGYTIEDVVDQVLSAMDAQSVVVASPRMTTIQNPIPRADRYGNQIQDKAVLECTRRHSKAELFTVVPKGDNNKPKKQKSHP